MLKQHIISHHIFRARGITKTLAVVLSTLNTLKSTKSTFLISQRCGEHPRPNNMGANPSPLHEKKNSCPKVARG